MAFLIVTSGALAGSGLHTVKAGRVAAAAGVLVVAVLASGVALGLRLGQARPAPGEITAADVLRDPDSPENRALIEHVGALSGRLIRLESEAMRLARRMGVAPAAEDGAARPAASGTVEPSGGPLVAPLAGPAARGPAGDGLAMDLGRIARELDRVEASLATVAQATTIQDLNGMAMPSRKPIAGGRISSGYGNRRDPFTHRLARHTGVDMPAPWGAPVLASGGGRVRFAGYRGAYGKTVEIDHGNGLVTRYGHASKLYVRAGDVVLPGQKIAAVGSTGRSTGPHLHFEVLRRGAPVEPRLYLSKTGS